jgi:hypothetical protein
MIARHERMRLGPGLPVSTIGMHADTARCLLQAPDHDAEIGRPPSPQCRLRALGPALNKRTGPACAATTLQGSAPVKPTPEPGLLARHWQGRTAQARSVPVGCGRGCAAGLAPASLAEPLKRTASYAGSSAGSAAVTFKLPLNGTWTRGGTGMLVPRWGAWSMMGPALG